MKEKALNDLYWGLVLAASGGVLLAMNLGYIDFEFSPRILRTYWPLILVVIGGSIVAKSLGRSLKKNADRTD